MKDTDFVAYAMFKQQSYCDHKVSVSEFTVTELTAEQTLKTSVLVSG